MLMDTMVIADDKHLQTGRLRSVLRHCVALSSELVYRSPLSLTVSEVLL